MTRVEIGEAIREKMNDQGKNISYFLKFGLNAHTVRNILTGENYKLESLFLVLKGLDMTMEIIKMEDIYRESYRPTRVLGAFDKAFLGL